MTKNIQKTSEVFFRIADNKLTLGILQELLLLKEKHNAEKILKRLQDAEIPLNDEIVKSNEFLGFTAKLIEALSFATRKRKVDLLIKGL